MRFLCAGWSISILHLCKPNLIKRIVDAIWLILTLFFRCSRIFAIFETIILVDVPSCVFPSITQHENLNYNESILSISSSFSTPQWSKKQFSAGAWYEFLHALWALLNIYLWALKSLQFLNGNDFHPIFLHFSVFQACKNHFLIFCLFFVFSLRPLFIHFTPIFRFSTPFFSKFHLFLFNFSTIWYPFFAHFSSIFRQVQCLIWISWRTLSNVEYLFVSVEISALEPQF